MGHWIQVAEARKVRKGAPLTVEIGDKKILLYNIDGRYFASDRICPHMGAPLDEGDCIGTEVICRWHMWSFDLNTGKCLSNPWAPEDLKVYPVRNDDGMLAVQLPDDPVVV